MATTLTQDQFKEKAKNWLNNKFIIAKTTKTDWYRKDGRSAALYKIQCTFSSFLSFANSYSVGDLAIKLKRNEDLLLLILPNPHNHSYNQAVTMLQDLLEYAGDFISQHNLNDLINK